MEAGPLAQHDHADQDTAWPYYPFQPIKVPIQVFSSALTVVASTMSTISSFNVPTIL